MKNDHFSAIVQTAIGRLRVTGIYGLGVVSIDWTDDDVTPEVDERFFQWIDKISRLDFDVPYTFSGTHFQICVWKEIMSIPRGEKVSYSQLANRLGNPKAVRAVATACGKNHHAMLVPCHRVVRSDGSIGKYRWGSEIKKMLLEFESE